MINCIHKLRYILRIQSTLLPIEHFAFVKCPFVIVFFVILLHFLFCFPCSIQNRNFFDTIRKLVFFVISCNFQCLCILAVKSLFGAWFMVELFEWNRSDLCRDHVFISFEFLFMLTDSLHILKPVSLNLLWWTVGFGGRLAVQPHHDWDSSTEIHTHCHKDKWQILLWFRFVDVF